MQEKEKSAGKGQKRNWFQGLQSEFKKIVWVDKQTIAVTIITVVLAVIISVFDSAILEGINLLVK